MRFRPERAMMPFFRVYRRNSQYKTPKNGKNKIRPANCKIDGVITPSLRGAVKNPNPRKGTETPQHICSNPRVPHETLRTTEHTPFLVRKELIQRIPERGRRYRHALQSRITAIGVRNHNPRKGPFACKKPWNYAVHFYPWLFLYL